MRGLLLRHLGSYEGVTYNTVLPHGGVNKHNFFLELEGSSLGPGRTREYGDKQPQVNQAILEAWQWLVSETLLVERAASGGGLYVLSRRAEQLKSSPEEFEAYPQGELVAEGPPPTDPTVPSRAQIPIAGVRGATSSFGNVIP